MSWVKSDDNMPIHRKVRPLSDRAYRLHSHAMHWCSRNGTDGHVTEEDLDGIWAEMPRLRGPVKHVSELVQRGLWDVTDDGWVLHDYLDYQPSAAKVQAEREAKKARQERWAAKARNAKTAPEDASLDAFKDATSDASRDVTPTRPGPPRPSPTGKGRGADEHPPHTSGHLQLVPDAVPERPPIVAPFETTPEQHARNRRGAAMASAGLKPSRFSTSYKHREGQEA